MGWFISFERWEKKNMIANTLQISQFLLTTSYVGSYYTQLPMYWTCIKLNPGYIGCPKKMFQIPKKVLESCLSFFVYPNMRFFFGQVEYFNGTLFWDTRYRLMSAAPKDVPLSHKNISIIWKKNSLRISQFLWTTP